MFWYALGSVKVLQTIYEIMSLYLLVNLFSLSIPLLVSFHPRLKLYKYFPGIFFSIGMAMIPYIAWDIWFTKSAFWGFNPAYLIGVDFWHLPIEEWLFFVIIPYACIFTHIALIQLFPSMILSDGTVKRLTFSIMLVFLVMGVVYYDKWYTLMDMVFGILVLGITYSFSRSILKRYYLTFIFMLIPFFIVNGILTGTGIEGEVVWYDDSQNMGLRLGTIPLEDSVYAFSLILLNLLMMDWVIKENLVRQPMQLKS